MVESTQVIASDIQGDMTCTEYGKMVAQLKRPSFLRRLFKAMKYDRT